MTNLIIFISLCWIVFKIAFVWLFLWISIVKLQWIMNDLIMCWYFKYLIFNKNLITIQLHDKFLLTSVYAFAGEPKEGRRWERPVGSGARVVEGPASHCHSYPICLRCGPSCISAKTNAVIEVFNFHKRRLMFNR